MNATVPLQLVQFSWLSENDAPVEESFNWASCPLIVLKEPPGMLLPLKLICRALKLIETDAVALGAEAIPLNGTLADADPLLPNIPARSLNVVDSDDGLSGAGSGVDGALLSN